MKKVFHIVFHIFSTFLFILALTVLFLKLGRGEGESLTRPSSFEIERISVSSYSTYLRHRVERLDKRVNALMLPAIASWYGDKFHGRRTASGEVFDQWGNTCACNFLPAGTWVLLDYRGRRAFARVSDRGAFGKLGRHFDLSRGIAEQLQMTERGVVVLNYKVIRRKNAK